jgi:hypothetical protein
MADSGKTRYNSEVGVLLAFCDVDVANFDAANPNIESTRLAHPHKICEDIKTYLNREHIYDSDELTKWSLRGREIVPVITKKLKELGEDWPTVYDWAAGTNRNPNHSADISFVDSKISGVSIKSKSGITLNNPSPKELGIDNSGDFFLQYAPHEYISWKTQVFESVLDLAHSQPGVRIGGKKSLDKYYIVYHTADEKFSCVGKKTLVATRQEILDKVSSNGEWQRGFGDWFVANYRNSKVSEFMKPLRESITQQFMVKMIDHLSKDSRVARLLKFADAPFFYANPSKVYYVPSIRDADALKLKSIRDAKARGATIKFFLECGMENSDDVAAVEIHFRYANGVFEENPTCRIQSLKNPQHIGWELLI